MQIKAQQLSAAMTSRTYPLYWLIGQDNYLVDEQSALIESQLKKTHDCEKQYKHILSPGDWQTFIEEDAKHYSLFSETTLFILYYDKKTLDAQSKKHLNDYLASPNSKSFIIIKAPNLPAKQIQSFCNHQESLCVISYALNERELVSRIITKLNQIGLQFEPDVPELISQFNQGNLGGCMQLIERLYLCYGLETEATRIFPQQVLLHLTNQSTYSLYALTDACLSGQNNTCIQIIRYIANSNEVELTFALWVLSDMIRTLCKLLHKINTGLSYKDAAIQTKIPPFKQAQYQNTLKRLNQTLINQLLRECALIDELIKSNGQAHAWQALERLALALSSGVYLERPCIT